MRRDFEGGVYWDEMADRCGDISRAAGFRGNTVYYGCNVHVNTTTVDFSLDLEQQHLLVNMLKPGDPSEGR